MKNKPTRKLELGAQHVRVLTDRQLAGIVGGALQPVAQGFLMKDTVIVPTSR